MKQGEEGFMKREEATGRCYPAQSVRTREVLVSGNDGSARRDEARTSAAIGICSSYVREQRLMLGNPPLQFRVRAEEQHAEARAVPSCVIHQHPCPQPPSAWGTLKRPQLQPCGA